MPQIAGFRGVLPDPAKANELAAKPLDVKPGLAAGALKRDGSRAVYRYHQVFTGPGRALTRKSLLCAVQLSPWTDGIVRPHEATDAAARDAALARIKAAGAHVEPVVAGFRDPATEVDRLMRKVESAKPTLEVTTADGTVHRVWRMQDAEVLGKLRHHLAPKKLHVLAGHAEYEAMLAYQAELAAKASFPTYSSANYGLACLVSLDEPALATAPRHRIVRAASISRDAVLAAAKAHFIIDKLAGAAKDVGKQVGALQDTVAHQPAFVAVFAGDDDAWKLTLSPDVSPLAEGVAVHRALQKLDPIAIQHMFLDRAVKSAQVTTTIDAADALAQLGKGADLALIVRPLSVEQIAHVDELGGLLPAGSTALHPQLAPGLVALVIDPDEDLV